MTTMFDDRERAYEAKFVHDEALRFRVHARRDKLFAHWAAELAGLSEAAADALVAEVIHIPDRTGHDAALEAQIGAVLLGHGHVVSEAELAAALQRCAALALEQLLAMPLDHPGAV